MIMSKAERLSRTARKKSARLKQVLKHGWSMSPSKLGLYIKTPKVCSCHMCGNPRKFYNQKTIKEKRDLEIFREELKSFR